MSNPVWRHIADDLADKIDKGTYPPGTRLPKLDDLCTMYGVGRKAVQTALIVLQDRGMVQGRHGVGYFVIGPPQRPVSPPSGTGP